MSVSKLILEDGSVYYGYPFGYQKSVAGEVVFNTGMVGYPESLTDPSYKGQILVFTYPLIGNYGMPDFSRRDGILNFYESDRGQVQGLIVSEYSLNNDHRSAELSLDDWLKNQGIPGIYGIDTRSLTKKLRDRGTMLGKIIYSDNDPGFYNPNKENLATFVSIKDPVFYEAGRKKMIALLDCGCKNGIIRSLLNRGVSILRVPWDYDVSNEKFDGLLISNGPGDPKMYKQTISNVRKIIERNLPILGICLGNQILALAAGADTYKLKFGHRSQNQPCLKAGSKHCYITPQNHGYAVNTKSLQQGWVPWYSNLNDGTNEGIRHISKPFYGVQFHPEASPGPTDTCFIFDQFIGMLDG
jgi:carbamoyl-phosphate synthase small subunit